MKSIIINKTKYFLLSWEDIEKDTLKLAKQISPKPTMIITILRGGLIVARLLSDFLNVFKIRTFGLKLYKGCKRKGKPQIYQPLKENLSAEDVLLIDDVADTGTSIKIGKQIVLALEPRSIRTAVLYIKPWVKQKPDYFVRSLDGWIIYPWERMEFIKEIANKYTKKRKKG